MSVSKNFFVAHPMMIDCCVGIGRLVVSSRCVHDKTCLGTSVESKVNPTNPGYNNVHIGFSIIPCDNARPSRETAPTLEFLIQICLWDGN